MKKPITSKDSKEKNGDIIKPSPWTNVSPDRAKQPSPGRFKQSNISTGRFTQDQEKSHTSNTIVGQLLSSHNFHPSPPQHRTLSQRGKTGGEQRYKGAKTAKKGHHTRNTTAFSERNKDHVKNDSLMDNLSLNFEQNLKESIDNT